MDKKEKQEMKRQDAQEPIAVIGMACRFPGGLNTVEKFWQSLLNGECKIKSPPTGRWEKIKEDFKESPYLKMAGFLDEDVNALDDKTFRLTPKEARKIDPHQRLLLKVCWEAFENAGYAPGSFRESNTGIFVGASIQDYSNQLYLQREKNNEYDALDVTSSGFSFLAGRISYFLGLQGPSITIDTACSSSLTAIHQACRSLQAGDCDMAAASGVNLLLSAETTILLSKLNILSPTCTIRPFDDCADGTVRGEGCGAVILKRLSDAKRDGDLIEAVIMGGSVNQDGPSSGLTAPYGPAQEKLLSAAWQNSHVDERKIGYLETHGTGTKLGDPIEIMSVANVISANRKQPLYVGAVKANLGHLEAAAGIAGVIKAIQAVKEGVIPANLNYETPSKYIDWENIPIEVVSQNTPYPSENGVRIAGVSAFGLSGTNVHIVLRNESDDRKNNSLHQKHESMVVKFSAHNINGLYRQVEAFQSFLVGEPKANLVDICYSQNISKADFSERLCLLTKGESKSELCAKLGAVIEKGVIPDHAIYGNKKRQIVFIFSGQGAQYPRMCKALYEKNEIFKSYLNECDQIYKLLSGSDLLSILFKESEEINRTQYTQPALFAIEYAMAKMWLAYGVEPDTLLGHSVGEYAAACIAGVFSLKDAMGMVIARGTLMENIASNGKMLALSCNRKKTEDLIHSYKSIEIAATNKEDQTVIAGCCEEIDEISDALAIQGIKATPLNVNKPFHSSLLSSIIPMFEKVSQTIRYHNPKKHIISNLTGKQITFDIARYQYWSEHILSEVKFMDSIKSLGDPDHYLYLEIGPNPVLSPIIDAITKGKANGIFSHQHLIREDENPMETVYKAAMHLYTNGQNLNWKKLCASQNCVFTQTPNFVFQEMSQKNLNDASISALKKSTFTLHDMGRIKEYIENALSTEIGLKKGEISDQDNLLSVGLNSIIISQLLHKFSSELHIRLSISSLIQNSTIEGWGICISRALKEKKKEREENVETVKLYPDQQYEKFPLNEVQYAYWVGRNKEVYLGGISCCASFEINFKDLDIFRFEQALSKLVARHAMLRCIIHTDGSQQIVENIQLPLTVYRREEIQDLQKHLDQVYANISRQALSLDKPLFEIVVTEMNNHNWRIHFAIDFMIADALSVHIFWRDLNHFYLGNELQDLSLTFRDYLKNQSEKRPRIDEKEYWINRIETFPAPPRLPIRNNVKDYGGFTRRKYRIPPAKWARFSSNAGKYGLTASAALLALYAEVISAWGGGSHFAIMLTVFNRKNIHREVNDIIGDFTTLSLLEVKRKQRSFGKNAKHLQRQMQVDLEHREYSGMSFLKELRNKQGNTLFYPVVFTSALGMEQLAQDSDNHFLSGMNSILSSTPQALLDFQVYFESGEIVISWDSRDNLFFPQALDCMFKAYCTLIKDAIDMVDFWEGTANDLRTPSEVAAQQEANKTELKLGSKTLHEGFLDCVRKKPNASAIIYQQKAYSYQILKRRADQISYFLRSKGISRGDRIIIQMKKSFEQIAAALGVVQMGCAYIPCTFDQPAKRTAYILEETNAKAIFLDEKVCERELSEILQITPQMSGEVESGGESVYVFDPQQMAYVIYTSGSTGKPKGVCITHEAAMNTVDDVNRRFQICENDRALSLSSLSFDLSVYDIFGMLSIGGSIVIPTEQERIDPKSWLHLLTNHGVTVWNSVPALMTLLTDYMMAKKVNIPTMKTIMLSGDWIPIHLPQKIFSCFPCGDLFSLGGATEASIWSNYYPVTSVDAEWSSIPYGFPLANQSFHILDEFGRNCPEWVEGRLCIAGKGLSTGYLANPSLTEKAFFYSDYLKKKLYETGDYGRYRNGGVIEFLGRKDSQIKVNGYRIELGEIKSALTACGVEGETQISVIGSADEDKKLIAFIVGAETPQGEERLLRLLREYLPTYYIPEKIIWISKMPVTGNGKIDQRKLADIYQKKIVTQSLPTGNKAPLLQTIKTVFNLTHLEETDSFAKLGVSSVDIIRLANALEKQYGERPTVGEMMSYQKISELIDYYQNSSVLAQTREISHQTAFALCPYNEKQISFLETLQNNEWIEQAKFPDHWIENELPIEITVQRLSKGSSAIYQAYTSFTCAILQQIISLLTKRKTGCLVVVAIGAGILNLPAGHYYVDTSANTLSLLRNEAKIKQGQLSIQIYQDIKEAYDIFGQHIVRKGYMLSGSIIACIEQTALSYGMQADEIDAQDLFWDIPTTACLYAADIVFASNKIKQTMENASLIIKRCEEKGIKLYLEEESLKYKAPKDQLTKEILAELREFKTQIIDYLIYAEITGTDAGSFPLTPIQRAYVMGRSSGYELSNTSAHYYVEFEWKDLDIIQLERAINTVIYTHEMLRTIIDANGTQMTLEEIPYYQLPIRELPNKAAVLSSRQALSHRVFPLGQWPMFQIQVNVIPNQEPIVQFDFDCTILDGWSSQLMLRDIYQAYLGNPIYCPKISIKDYILAESDWIETHTDRSADEAYWEQRVKSLPSAPALPMTKPFHEVEKISFLRKSFMFTEQETKRFMQIIKKYKVTPSALLCTIFMKLLSVISGQTEITLNLTLFNRVQLHADVDRLLGDFTNITLVSYRYAEKESVQHEVEQMQQQLWELIEHRNYNGLKAVKRLASDSPGKAIMPVVFTSMLFKNEEESATDVFGVVKELYAISQTPQVSLDHQAMFRNGKLHIVWDYVEDLFDKKEIEQWFQQYVSILRYLFANEEWNQAIRFSDFLCG